MDDIEIVIRGKPKAGKSRMMLFLATRLNEVFDGKVLVDDPECRDVPAAAARAIMETPSFIRQFRESGRRIVLKTEQSNR